MTEVKPPTVMKPASGMSIAGLVIGICSIALFWIPGIHFILAVLGIIFGSIALSRNEKFGTAGLTCSLLSYVPVLIYWVWLGYVIATSTT